MPLSTPAEAPVEQPAQEFEVPEVAETQQLTEAPELVETPEAVETAEDPNRPKRRKKN